MSVIFRQLTLRSVERGTDRDTAETGAAGPVRAETLGVAGMSGKPPKEISEDTPESAGPQRLALFPSV